MSVPGEQIGPHYDVTIFDVGEARIDVFFLRVRLGCGEEAIEIGGVGFILPMVLELVDVDLVRWGLSARGGGGGGGLQGRSHPEISPKQLRAGTGNP
jgi:hypothetical protein